MNLYKNNIVLVFFIMIHVAKISADFDDMSLDVVRDFAYPVSSMQNIRHYAAQAVYALECSHYDQALSFLELVYAHVSQINEKRAQNISNQDDKDFLQHMLDKINDLINQLEQMDNKDDEQKRSQLLSLSSSIQNQL